MHVWGVGCNIYNQYSSIHTFIYRTEAGVHTNFYKSTENYIIYSVKTIATLLIAITLNFNITMIHCP